MIASCKKWKKPSIYQLCYCECCETHLLYVFQSNEWSKNDERLLSAVEHGETEKVTSLLAKKGASATKLDGEGKSA